MGLAGKNSEDAEPLRLSLYNAGTWNELRVQRGSWEETVGYLNSMPLGLIFTNNAQDMMCYVIDGNGWRQLEYGETVTSPPVSQIGVGRGRVEIRFGVSYRAD